MIQEALTLLHYLSGLVAMYPSFRRRTESRDASLLKGADLPSR